MRYSFLTLLVFIVLRPASGQSTSALRDSVLKYSDAGNYRKSHPFVLEYTERVAKEAGLASEAYAYALGLRGEINLRIRKIPEAKDDLQASLDLYKKVAPADNLDVANVVHNLGSLLFNMEGDLVNAEPFLLRAEAIKTRLLPDMDADFILTWRNLASLYLELSQYEKAESYFKKSLAANQKHFPDDPNRVPDAWGELGIFYAVQGNLPKAETACLTAIKLFSNHYKEDEIPSGTLNTLGHVYDGLGNYPKAEQYYLKAYNVVLKTLPPEHPVQYKMLTSLGGHYVLAEKYDKAVYWLEKAIQTRDKLPAEAIEQNAFEEGNLMIAYLRLGHFHKAEKMGKAVNAVREKMLGPLHYNTANGYGSMAELYLKTNKMAEARMYMDKMGDAYEKSYGNRLPDFKATFDRGEFEWEAGQLAVAKKLLSKSMQMMRGDVNRFFPALSDHEKAQYYEDQVKRKVAFFTSFSIENAGRFPDLSGDLYNLTLSSKALLLSTSARWKQRIKTSGDKKLFALYTQWEGLQNQLANWHSKANPGTQKELDSTIAMSEKIEKELSVRSEVYGKMADREPPTWKQVQARLKPGEAAIEMVRFQKLGIREILKDTSDPQKPTYWMKGRTDTIQYAALIVKQGAVQPEIVLLKNGNELEGKSLNFYKNCIQNQQKDTRSYQQFWEKIGRKLGPSIQKVYFSPEGVYHSINLNTLQNPATGKYLLEEKEIRMVTVTRDLLLPTTGMEQNQLAYLFGFPDYNMDETNRQSTANKLRNSPELSYSFNKIRGDAFSELPGTKLEIESIAEVLSGKGWEVQALQGAEALEETLKESLKPRVLHLATHGFFHPDTSVGSNPLLQSGLLLTGANRAFQGERSDRAEDGILTAYEAMNLNLDNTDLVVLSACETGLGEIKNGEGVYGLQRAFKVAGAKSIIMSLWKVDDAATQELMVSFYKNWLGKRSPDSLKLSGLSKRQAFLKAQKELKTKYPDPYYWGAFVMVGE